MKTTKLGVNASYKAEYLLQSHPAYQSMLYYNKMRYKLIPYIYSLNGMVYDNDYTMMRGLVMDYGADAAVNNINDQYMFGPSLLINPVTEYKATSRKVYLPKGNGWYNLYTGEYAAGGQVITTSAPYQQMPVYVKEGSIIPTGPEIQYTAEKSNNPVTIYVYGGKDASFTLYEDEGTNYNYEKGAFSQILFSYNEQTKTLTIGDRQGDFKRMLQNRLFNIVLVNSKEKTPLLLNEQTFDNTIHYEGKKVSIKL